jgi:PAT family beta-lactamase induction signal transducer AmpG
MRGNGYAQIRDVLGRPKGRKMNILSTLPALSESRLLRLWAFFLLYISQGVPIGLASIAIPAWLAAKGASVGDLGFVMGIVMLPWALKLVNGMVIDRFCYAPMGRKRAWVIGAQVAMLATLAAAALLNPAPADLVILAALGFTLNLCATVSDVAVDGMAVDLIPEEEREQVNAWMMSGQALGYAGTGALSAVALASGGVALAAFACSVVVSLLLLFMTVLRERPGERLLPWMAGSASSECLERKHTRFLPILKQVALGLVKWRTALFLVGATLICSSISLTEIFGPTFSASDLGWSSEDYPSFYGAISAVIAVAMMVSIGPLIRKFGNIAVFIAFAGVMMLANISVVIVGTDAFSSLAMQIYIVVIWAGFIGIVALIVAWSMNLTNPLVAASQFSLFMAIPNFSRSLSLGGYGQLIEKFGYDASFLVAAVSIGAGVIICLLAGYGRLATIPALAASNEPLKSPPQSDVPMGVVT